MSSGPEVEHLLQARDGCALRGLLLDVGDARGTVVVRTPYDARSQLALASSWCERGYRCLLQDVRGRYRSDGDWVPYAHEAPDGVDTVRALRMRYDGEVVLFGASYAAHTAVEAARGLERRHDPPVTAVVALVPALGLHETARSVTGEPRLRERIGWWHEHGFGRCSVPPLPAGELARRTALAERRGPLAAADSFGWSADQRRAWLRLWSARPLDLAGRYGDLRTALLVIGGEQDFFSDHAVALTAAWGNRVDRNAHHATGPWGHRLAAGVTDPIVRRCLDTAGGPGAFIDGWLAFTVGTPAGGAAGQIADALATVRPRPGSSTLVPAIASWHHECLYSTADPTAPKGNSS